MLQLAYHCLIRARGEEKAGALRRRQLSLENRREDFSNVFERQAEVSVSNWDTNWICVSRLFTRSIEGLTFEFRCAMAGKLLSGKGIRTNDQSARTHRVTMATGSKPNGNQQYD